MSFNLRVYGILINEQNQLLVSDEYIRGMKITKFPGGGLEFGEGTRDCLKREFLEESKNIPSEFVKYSRMYDIKLIKKFLDLLRESGVTNMYAAAPYLYMGKDRIAHQHYYDDMDESREEKFEVLKALHNQDTKKLEALIKKYTSKPITLKKIPKVPKVSSKKILKKLWNSLHKK